MSFETDDAQGLDFGQGVPFSSLVDGHMLAGHVGDQSVFVVRRGEEIFAVGAACTHYGAPLAEGLLVNDTVRCPWHHACFSLRTGEALRGPALKPIPCYDVERTGDLVRIRARRAAAPQRILPARPGLPESIVIVGAGAAGEAAAETLRREGYAGRLTLLSADDSAPYDRPNLSKGFLAGTSPDSDNSLRSAEFYQAQNIELTLNARVGAIDTTGRHVELTDGRRYAYDALLLATGAEPVRLGAGDDLPHVHYLRTLADSHALTAEAMPGRRAVVIGASFIGLEVAASLRARGVEVSVIAPDTVPMQGILGEELGGYLRSLHEDHGVHFHLGTKATSIGADGVTVKSGRILGADFIVAGIGVRPRLTLAERAGLELDRGIKVDAFLETSVEGIFAAGDIARWPDRLTGEAIRVEHWAVAQRQGQTAARNMLGMRERFDCVPFFWTEQYDFSLAYVGHAEKWDQTMIEGQLHARDCKITYRRNGEALAVAVVHRDLEGLRAELQFEQAMAGRERPSLRQAVGE